MNREEYIEFIKKYPEAAPFFEYIGPNSRSREGYYRLIPHTRFEPHENQIKMMLLLAKASYDSYGKKGFKVIDGRPVPIVAAEIGRKLKGVKIAKPKHFEVLRKLAVLQRKLEVVAQATQ